MLGVSGAVVLARLSFLLPYALLGAGALLAVAFWWAYRPPAACADGTCDASGRHRLRRIRLLRVLRRRVLLQRILLLRILRRCVRLRVLRLRGKLLTVQILRSSIGQILG